MTVKNKRYTSWSLAPGPVTLCLASCCDIRQEGRYKNEKWLVKVKFQATDSCELRTILPIILKCATFLLLATTVLVALPWYIKNIQDRPSLSQNCANNPNLPTSDYMKSKFQHNIRGKWTIKPIFKIISCKSGQKVAQIRNLTIEGI